MTKKDKQVLIDGLKKLSADVAEIAALLEGAEAPTKKQDAPVEETSPAATEEAPAKVYTYEEVRAILAEKSREVQDRVPGRGQSDSHRARCEAAFRCSDPRGVCRDRRGSGGDW